MKFACKSAIVAWLPVWIVGHLMVAPASAEPATQPATRPTFQIGRIDAPAVKESSGVVASRRFPGVFWTENDSGNPSQLFAITRTGKLLASFDVAALNVDWEDITVDDAAHVYLADIGNNGGWRRELKIYQLDEPDPAAATDTGTSLKQDGKTSALVDRRLKITQSWTLTFPAGTKPFDCESFFIWKSDGYVISKMFNGSQATLYTFPLDQNGSHELKPVVTLPIRSPVTGADLSEDGRRLAVVTNFGPNLFDLPAPGDFSKLASTRPASILWLDVTMEAICFAPPTDTSPAGLLTTAEGRTVSFFPFEAFAQAQTSATVDATRVVLSKANSEPTVDGALDEWDTKVDEIRLRMTAGHENEPRAKLWGQWTEQGIYLAGTVPTKAVAPLAKTWFAGDCVEIFLGHNAANRSPEYGPGDDRCYLGFTGVKTEKGKPDALGPMVLRWPRHEANPSAGPAPSGQVAGRANVDGSWQFEVFLPWQVEGKKLVSGDSLRLNVSILSRDPKVNWFISQSNDSGTWMSPTTWATADLKLR